MIQQLLIFRPKPVKQLARGKQKSVGTHPLFRLALNPRDNKFCIATFGASKTLLSQVDPVRCARDGYTDHLVQFLLNIDVECVDPEIRKG